MYFIIALVLPWAKYLSSNVKNKRSELAFWLFMIVAYAIYYIVFAILNKSNNDTFRFITITLGIESVGWIICAFAFSKILSNKKKAYYLLAVLAVFIICAIYYGWSNVDMYKYPPRLYYISYGLAVSLLLTLFFNIKSKGTTISEIICKKFKPIQWMSKNSLWIYYWHMLYLSLFKFVIAKVAVLNKWFVLYALVLIFSIITTLVINYIETILESRLKMTRNDN